MQPWERGILEYRPRLTISRSVLSKVRELEGTTAAYEPTDVMKRAATVLASDVIDNVMASLSRANDILKKTDKCLVNDPTYRKYRDAKDQGDLLEARDVFSDNLKNIKGIPQLDVIPMLEDLKDEMEVYLGFLNDELFDGKADYNDTESARALEERNVEGLLRLEQEQKTVDYSQVSSRIKTISACGDRAGWYRDTIDKSDDYLLAKANTYLAGDVEGTLRYIDETPENHIPLLKQTMEASFRQNAVQAGLAYDNMDRAGGRDFREMLNKQMSESRKMVHDVFDPLATRYNNDLDSQGAEIFKMKYRDSADQIPSTFDYMVVENITNTVLNAEQTGEYFSAINSKKEAQEYNKLLNLVEQEYGRGNPDREIPRLIKANRLDAPGTYCG